MGSSVRTSPRRSIWAQMHLPRRNLERLYKAGMRSFYFICRSRACAGGVDRLRHGSL